MTIQNAKRIFPTSSLILPLPEGEEEIEGILPKSSPSLWEGEDIGGGGFFPFQVSRFTLHA